LPFKSESQRKFMNAAAARGDIKQSTVDEFNKASKNMKLPKKVKQHLDEGGQVKSKEEKDKDHYKKLKEMMGFKS
jgi:hypothetical protein